MLEAAEAPPARRPAGRAVWRSLLAGVAPLVVLALVYVVREVAAGAGDGDEGDATVVVALGLVLLSTLLLTASVLPAGVVARIPVPSTSFERYRQPLALAAIGILVPVLAFALVTALT